MLMVLKVMQTHVHQKLRLLLCTSSWAESGATDLLPTLALAHSKQAARQEESCRSGKLCVRLQQRQ